MSKFSRRVVVFVLVTISDIVAFAQSPTFEQSFSQLYDYPIHTARNLSFNEFYEISIPQPLDHSNPRRVFSQRIFVGIRDLKAPIVIVTEGYAIDYVSDPGYSNELANELHANIVVVEHRFFGKSVPDSLDWNYLTTNQAADDCHLIRLMLEKLLTGKWISTGVSKGGQAALSYKMHHPGDVCATVVYGTAIKNKQIAFTDTVLSGLSETSCGRKVNELQRYLFRHKNAMLSYLAAYACRMNLQFGALSEESVLDYMLLELPFSFWQNDNKCEEIPDTTSAFSDLAGYLIRVVPPRYFSTASHRLIEPAFFMFYHELGYYEYHVAPFAKYISEAGYSNKYFAPRNTDIKFDDRFQIAVETLINSASSQCIFFIYGQNDPWAMQTTATRNIFVVPGGSHRSRISDLSLDQQKRFYVAIRACIDN